ncbi:MAG: c-type cytochrome [Gemmatimonadaceae bacterium]
MSEQVSLALLARPPYIEVPEGVAPTIHTELPLRPRVARSALYLSVLMLFVVGSRAFAQTRASIATASGSDSARVPFRIPSEKHLRDSGYRLSALRGRALLLATRDSLPRNVGSSLRCASCHLDGGLRPNAMPWVGSYARFPQYRARSGRVDLIEDRINDCFARSLNGKPLATSGRDMHDIVSYLAFLSSGIPVGAQMEGQSVPRLKPLTGNLSRGVTLFASTCARCHGADGQGTRLAPPVWGARSYNVGAGMANIIVAASFIHATMPFDHAVHLTEQQAFDVATYIDTRPRPNFSAITRDWPRGGKPPGTGYHVVPLPGAPTAGEHTATVPAL